MMKTHLTQQRVLPYSATKVWPLLSDTSKINRQLGLAPMSFETINGVRHGKQKILGLTTHWTEKPLEWKQNSWLKNERIYSRGFLKSIRSIFEIQSLSNERCQITIHFYLEHRYRCLSSLLNRATLNIMHKLLDEVERSVKTVISSTTAKKYKKSFKQWLQAAQPFERERILPKVVANEIELGWEKILQEALTDQNKDRFALQFDAVCPHCRGAKKSAPRLTDLPNKVACDSCEIEFPLGAQESIEVSVRDRSLPPDQAGFDFCSSDVSHKPRIIYQRLGGDWCDKLELNNGSYLLKLTGQTIPILLLIDDKSGDHEIDLDTIFAQPGNSSVSVTSNPTFKSHSIPSNKLIMLEKIEVNHGALTASEVMQNPDFQNLIPTQALISDFPMEMGTKTLLFTDVVGSTDLYYQIGDNMAFEKVRDSFLLIGSACKRFGGILVKTIGDATMFAFTSADDALRAAIDIQTDNRGHDLKLRISLHSGLCLCVTTADGQDYFGDTVNVCAKFQSEANADEIVFAQDLESDIKDDLWQIYAEQCRPISFALKGEHQHKFELFRLKI